MCVWGGARCWWWHWCDIHIWRRRPPALLVCVFVPSCTGASFFCPLRVRCIGRERARWTNPYVAYDIRRGIAWGPISNDGVVCLFPPAPVHRLMGVFWWGFAFSPLATGSILRCSMVCGAVAVCCGSAECGAFRLLVLIEPTSDTRSPTHPLTRSTRSPTTRSSPQPAHPPTTRTPAHSLSDCWCSSSRRRAAAASPRSSPT